MQIDLTISIVSILALCGIISPIVVAIINNRHNERMKNLDFKHNEFADVFREFTQKYHELYIHENATNSAEFQISSMRLAIICKDIELRNDLIDLGKLVMKSQCRNTESDELFEKCVRQMFHEI